MTLQKDSESPEASAPYDRAFFATQSTRKSGPSIILDHLFTMLPPPKTAIDLGCGKGGWLAALKDYSVEVLGIDGDYVPRDMLLIEQNEFLAADLTLPVFPSINKRFDLALSLEVAEHLPESRADSFVQDLTELSDRILFSAAIPYQGGTNHINCQWQSYWADKFLKRGYQADISLRNLIWDDKRIGNVYRENIVLYTKIDNPKALPYIDAVHPEIYYAIKNHTKHVVEKYTAHRVEEYIVKRMELFIYNLAKENNSMGIRETFQAFRDLRQQEKDTAQQTVKEPE